MSSAQIDDGPVPLHLPSILQNPANHALRQVEAHNTQQRERLLARKAARGVDRNVAGGSGTRGKRVIRRQDNATFVGNAHIVQPRRGDFYPPVPLQSHPVGPSFPRGAIPRSESVASGSLPPKDPGSSSSVNGAFGTSLKGVRNMLRKRGRRAEGLVSVVEKEIRGWLDSARWTFTVAAAEEDEGQGPWKIIDAHLVPIAPTDGEGGRPQGRRLPPQHQVTTVPPIPTTGGLAASVLELSRSPAHLTWHVTDSFERLVVHLLARYYELISWSEDHPTLDNGHLRLTHIIQPSLLRPRAAATLLSPETTDISGQSSSEVESVHGSTSDSGGRSDDTESETETERGSVLDPDEHGEVEGYSLQEHPGDTTVTGLETPSFEEAMAELDLREHGAPLARVLSSGSSMYASSEDGSEWSALGDSLSIPSGPRDGAGEGWSSIVPAPAATTAPVAARNATRNGAGGARKGWEEKPTFFEYLYGA